MRRGTPRWATRATVGAIIGLYLPALLSFGTHVAEHAWPLGFTRALPGNSAILPTGVALMLLWFAGHCVVPTWCGMGLALLASARLALPVAARSGLGVLSAIAFVSMRGMDAVLHSCWGEAPHAFWFPFKH